MSQTSAVFNVKLELHETKSSSRQSTETLPLKTKIHFSVDSPSRQIDFLHCKGWKKVLPILFPDICDECYCTVISRNLNSETSIRLVLQNSNRFPVVARILLVCRRNQCQWRISLLAYRDFIQTEKRAKLMYFRQQSEALYGFRRFRRDFQCPGA